MDVEALPTAADDLGEGPVWEPETGVLWWVDITGRAVRSRRLRERRGAPLADAEQRRVAWP